MSPVALEQEGANHHPHPNKPNPAHNLVHRQEGGGGGEEGGDGDVGSISVYK